MNIVKSYDFFKPEQCTDRLHIIGCGAIGSTVAENLVRFGLTKITLYDFDRVEDKNIANQIYTSKDIGMYKVDALARYLMDINPDLKGNLRVVKEGYTNQRLSGYVFLAVDNIDLRRQICEANQDNRYIKGVFDWRMRLTDAQHYAADWSDPKSVQNLIASMQFSHEEAAEATPMSACNQTLSVVPTVRMICSAGVSNFINFVKNHTLKKIILLDAFSFELDAI
jgi:hypothetical protein